MIKIGELCPFCSELYNLEPPDECLATETVPKIGLRSRIIGETKNFIVAPTLGAFVEGYVLIVAKHHYPSVSQMPISKIKELRALMNRVKREIRSVYGTRSVCFEHGESLCSRKAGGCISHTHVHVVPCDATMIEKIQQLNLDAVEIPSILSLSAQYSQLPYLYFQDVTNKQYVFSGQVYPSQLFRQILASYYNLGEKWDWRRFQFEENIKKTIERLRIG